MLQILTPQISSKINIISTFNYDEIEVMIDLIEEKYRKVFTNYKELADIINKEFKVNLSESDIWSYEDNYYDIDSQDNKIHYKLVI